MPVKRWLNQKVNEIADLIAYSATETITLPKMWKTLRELQEVQNEVGYDPGQKMRDRMAINTEVQLGYAPGIGAFGVPIVKPRKRIQPERPDLKANFLRLKRLADKMDKGGE